MNTTASASIPAGLTSSDLEQARLFLDQTHSGIVGAIKHLSATQWNFKPVPDRWSIGENVEHIVFVQELVLGRVRDQLPQAPAGPADRDYQAVDAIVIGRFPHRLAKFNAPEPLHPSGRFASPLEALPQLAENTVRLTQHLESTPDLRQHVLEAIPLKAVTQGAHTVMDGYQWILTAAAHTERHTKQILEVMAGPNFPTQ